MLWGVLWQASLEPQPPEDWWPELRRRAREQETRQVSLEDVSHALKCFRTRIGQGGDKINPRWWLQLPEEGLDNWHTSWKP